MAYLARSAFSGDNDDPLKQSDLQKEQESGRNLDGRNPPKQTEVKVNDVSKVKLAEKNEFEEVVISMSQEYLDSQNKQNSLGRTLWQIQIDMQKESIDNRQTMPDFSKESNSTLLSVALVAGAWTEREKMYHGGSFLKLADDNMDIQNPEAQNRELAGF